MGVFAHIRVWRLPGDNGRRVHSSLHHGLWVQSAGKSTDTCPHCDIRRRNGMKGRAISIGEKNSKTRLDVCGALWSRKGEIV